ncbi:MAG: polysaccharide pyruvyl transferase family protein [Acidimicrobiales bacterium]
MATRIAVTSGYYSQNIGNAFFQLGGRALIERAAPEADVFFVPDSPGNWTLWRKSSGRPRASLDIIQWYDPDLLVLQGPTLRRGFDEMWASTFEELKARGTRVLLLGIGLFRFDSHERSLVRDLADSGLVAGACARDEVTHQVLTDAGIESVSGLDSAFFLPWAYQPNSLDGSPHYVVVNFDRFPEPRISARTDEPSAGLGATSAGYALPDATIMVRPAARVLGRLAGFGHVASYAGQALRRRRTNDSVGPYTIVRTSNRANPPLHRLNYRHPNSFVADEPFSYLDLLANAELVMADRVHSCVAAAAYGRPSWFLGDTPRAGLLDQVNAEPPVDGKLVPKPGLLEERRETQCEWLHQLLSDLAD